MGKKVIVLIGLLIAGFTGAVLLWALVYLPFKVVQPIEFIPMHLTEETAMELEEKIDAFTSGDSGTIDLDRAELGFLLKTGLVEELGIDVTSLSVDLEEGRITVIVQVRVTDIPSTGYLTWILTRRDVEYTTTLVSALVWAEQGKVAYELLDFRVGSFRIPQFLVRRILGNGRRSVGGLYIGEVGFHDGVLQVTRN